MAKSKASDKLKIASFTLSQANLDYIEKQSSIQTRGNRSLWLDQKLSEMSAKNQGE